RAKKSEQKVAEKVLPEKEVAEKEVELPQHKAKPKQGIGSLPKLPNEGAVVMDDKSFKLSSVVAYEVFENGQWFTKIVATERPIKKESLLSKLKKTGTEKDKDQSPPAWPQPYLQVELDEDDRPTRLNLLADGTPGGASGNEVTGTALVEDGRAR